MSGIQEHATVLAEVAHLQHEVAALYGDLAVPLFEQHALRMTVHSAHAPTEPHLALLEKWTSIEGNFDVLLNPLDFIFQPSRYTTDRQQITLLFRQGAEWATAVLHLNSDISQTFPKFTHQLRWNGDRHAFILQSVCRFASELHHNDCPGLQVSHFKSTPHIFF